jgi:DNA-binding winged helix-turn-helix (wHTH) protein
MPRYIETLPRRGYRFIAALDADPEPAPSAAPAPPPLTVPVPSGVGSVVDAETVGSARRSMCVCFALG